MIDQGMNYIRENLVQVLIIAYSHEYLFSSAMDYAGEKGLVEIQTEV